MLIKSLGGGGVGVVSPSIMGWVGRNKNDCKHANPHTFSGLNISMFPYISTFIVQIELKQNFQ